MRDGDVPDLLPGAPEPEPQFVTLAILWAAGELGKRHVPPDLLGAEALTGVKTAIAAKALALMAQVKGVVTLENVAESGAARVIESIKIPDEIEVKYRAATSTDGTLALAAGQWDSLADGFLALAVPGTPSRGLFPGAAR